MVFLYMLARTSQDEVKCNSLERDVKAYTRYIMQSLLASHTREYLISLPGIVSFVYFVGFVHVMSPNLMRPILYPLNMRNMGQAPCWVEDL